MIACGRLYLNYVVKPKVNAFNVAYAPTETQNASNTHAVWITVNKAVEEVLKHELLFVLMGLDTRTGRRGKGVVRNKNIKNLDAYGRCTLNAKGELLLSFANNHGLALLNTFFSTHKGGVSHAFNGRGKKRIDYILKRQRGH